MVKLIFYIFKKIDIFLTIFFKIRNKIFTVAILAQAKID